MVDTSEGSRYRYQASGLAMALHQQDGCTGADYYHSREIPCLPLLN